MVWGGNRPWAYTSGRALLISRDARSLEHQPRPRSQDLGLGGEHGDAVPLRLLRLRQGFRGLRGGRHRGGLAAREVGPEPAEQVLREAAAPSRQP